MAFVKLFLEAAARFEIEGCPWGEEILASSPVSLKGNRVIVCLSKLTGHNAMSNGHRLGGTKFAIEMEYFLLKQ